MAVQEILKHNLYGLDIDDRAAQLSYFAVMMKALEYDKRFFNRDEQPQPQVYAIQESNTVKREQLKHLQMAKSMDRFLQWRVTTGNF